MKTKSLFITLMLTVIVITLITNPVLSQRRQRDLNLLEQRSPDNKTAGDWLEISAKREIAGYVCFLASTGIMFSSTFMDIEEDNKMPFVISGALGFTGFILQWSSAVAKRRAGTALNNAGIALDVKEYGVTLSYNF